MKPAANQQISEYVLDRSLGAGTFGEVWLAHHRAWIDQCVAIKIATDPLYIRSLQTEGMARHGLEHPNIVRAIGFDPWADPPYLVMEYVPGTSLRPYVEKGPMPPDQVVAVMRQILAGLTFAHEHGVIHRDIKPENILVHERAATEGLGAAGVVKITDFGMGQANAVARESIAYTVSIDQADARHISGTFDYMSPEQRQGAKVDARTDLYAAGVVMFELLTGHRPAGTEVPGDLVPGIPASLDEAFRRSYARLDWRFESAGQFNETLSDQSPPEAAPLVLESTIVVSPDGSADCRSITEAIQRVSSGGRVLVRPGLYQESLVLDKAVDIVGDGDVDLIVVDATDAHCLSMETDVASVRKLTLRNRPGTDGERLPAVAVGRGRLVLEGCDISSRSGSCVAIHGASTDPIIRGCWIHDGKQFGLAAYEGGRGTLEDCDLFGNELSGVAIGTNAAPTLRRCRIHECQQTGVIASNGGQGTLEDCDIFGNTLNGVVIEATASPTLRRCQIHDGKASGVWIGDDGKGTLDECDIFGNETHGVTIAGNADPILRRCKVRDGRGGGVLAYEGGKGTLEDCDISGNAMNGVEILTRADPTLRRCTIHDCDWSAVVAAQGGKGTLEDCDISGNSRSDVAIGMNADPTLRHCTIYGGNAGGVFAYEGGRGTLEDCDISDNMMNGVAIATNADPTLRRCRIHESQQSGLYASEGSQGTLEDCDIFGNTLSNVTISQDASPTLRRCTIHEGNQAGVYAYDGGQGTLEDCDIFGNVQSGLYIMTNAHPTLRCCTIRGNASWGIVAYDGGEGTVDRCDLAENTPGDWSIAPGCRVWRTGDNL